MNRHKITRTAQTATPTLQFGRTTSRLLLPSSYSSALFLLIVLSIEVGVVLFVIRDLHVADVGAERMYAGSVLGLRRIGELQYEAQETRRSTLYALTTNDSNLQVDYADQSRDADRRVSEGIREYLKQSQLTSEMEVGKRLMRDWVAYLRIRDEVLGLILEGSNKEAVDLDLAAGVLSFDRVRRDLEEIKLLYEEHASQQVAIVAGSSRRSIIRLIAAISFALVFGGISLWAIQRSKMIDALHLAKLQMDFVASVSHELRTPLTAILTAGENIRDGFVRDRPGLVEQGAIITSQASQLMDLFDQVLLFAATTRGRQSLTMRPLHVSEIVERALQSAARSIREAGFTVEQKIPPGLPRVMGDLPTLSRCLQNLIVNAVKYSATDQWIGLAVSMTETKDSEEIQISVQDRGVGIDGSELPRIFEPFYRSPAVVASQIHGAGLGLYIAKQNAEAAGGRLSVVSETGVGTVFTLHLPMLVEESEMTSVTSGGRSEISQ